MARLLAFLAELARRDHNARWIRDEMHGRLTLLRGQSELGERVIPACLESLAHSEIDDVVTAVWLMNACVSIDYDVLLELDALGAALDLKGCVTRIGFHVRDAVQIPSDPWDNCLTMQ